MINPQRYLSHFDLGNILELKELTSGVDNITFTVKSSTGNFILRIYSQERLPEHIAFEHKVLKYLANRNFFAPQIVKTREGNTYCQEDQIGALFHFLPGHELRGPEISPEHVHSVGETLGWFHEILKDFKTQFNKPAEDKEGIWEMINTYKSRLLTSNYSDINKLIYELIESLKQISFSPDLPQGVVHSNLHERNLLFRHHEVSGVLDFDNCYFGILIIDFATLIVWWCFRDKMFNYTFFQSLLKGYVSQRPLINIEKEYFWSALKFSIIKLIIRNLCLVYLKGWQNETYGPRANQINTDYFLNIYHECKRNKELITKYFDHNNEKKM